MRVCRLMIVVEGDGPDLVQSDWLRHSRLDWHHIQNVQVSDSFNRGLDTLLMRFADVFEKSKGPILPYLATDERGDEELRLAEEVLARC